MKKFVVLFLFFVFPALFCMDKNTKKRKAYSISEIKSKVKSLDRDQEGLTKYVNDKATQLYDLEDMVFDKIDRDIYHLDSDVAHIDHDVATLFKALKDEKEKRQKLEEKIKKQDDEISQLCQVIYHKDIQTPNNEW